MPSIVPAPPGYAVDYLPTGTRRFLPASPGNLFAIGFADRGVSGQIARSADLLPAIGGPVNYSSMFYSLQAAQIEGAGNTSWARVVGPEATKAALTLDDGAGEPTDVGRVTAKSPGAWANGDTGGLKAQVVAVSSARRLVITEGGVTVATSPLAATQQELVDWSDDNDYVDYEALETTLPAAVAATSLDGGDDDRDDVTAAEYAAALDLLDKRYGPGILVAPGITNADAHKKILEACASRNRRALLDLPAGVSKSDAITHAQTLQADVPELCEYGVLIASWVRVGIAAVEPARLIPWSAVQAGICNRVFRDLGYQTPAFGPTTGSSRTAVRLENEWSDEDRAELYAAGVCVATDDGRSISMWGYKTLNGDTLYEDAHAGQVRMALKFDAEDIARKYIAQPVDADSLASYASRLDALCKRYQRDRAIFGSADDPGYLVDVDSVNTPETMEAREIHAALRVRQTKSGDWVDLSIDLVPVTASV